MMAAMGPPRTPLLHVGVQIWKHTWLDLRGEMQQKMMFDKFKISWPGFKWLNPCVVAVCHKYTGQLTGWSTS